MRRIARAHLGTALALAAVMALPGARPRPAAAAAMQDLTEEPGYDRRGDDYNSFRTESAGECQRVCAREDRCQAYTWNARSGDCYLKSHINSPKRNGDMVTGYKRGGAMGGSGGGPGGGSLSEEWGYDRNGNDYRSFDVPGLEDCKRACTGDRHCQAYTFLSRSSTCYLKNRAGYPQRQNGAVTGAKGGGGGFNPWSGGLTEETGYDRRGDDYTRFRARTLGACKAACRRDSRCRAFSYIVSSADCYLKNRINSREYNPDAVTGYKEGNGP
jgi:hypothetical protein